MTNARNFIIGKENEIRVFLKEKFEEVYQQTGLQVNEIDVEIVGFNEISSGDVKLKITDVTLDLTK